MILLVWCSRVKLLGVVGSLLADGSWPIFCQTLRLAVAMHSRTGCPAKSPWPEPEGGATAVWAGLLGESWAYARFRRHPPGLAMCRRMRWFNGFAKVPRTRSEGAVREAWETLQDCLRRRRCDCSDQSGCSCVKWLGHTSGVRQHHDALRGCFSWWANSFRHSNRNHPSRG